MNDAPVRRISLRRKRKSCEIATEVPEQKRVSPSPDKSQNGNKYTTENKQRNKMGTSSKGKVSTNNSEMAMNEGEMHEVKQESPLTSREDTDRNIQESTPKSRGLNNSVASTCSILSSTLMHYSPDMPFFSSQLGATQECEVVWDCNSPGFSKEDLKKMYNKDSGSPSPVAAPIPPRALFPLGRKDKDKSTKKGNSNYAAQVTAQLDALLLKISSEKTDSRPSKDSSMSEDEKLELGLPCPLKEMASQPFIGDEVGNLLTEQDTQSVKNLGFTEFSEDMFAGEDETPSDIPVVKKEGSSSSDDLVGEYEEFQVHLECTAEDLKEWSPEDGKKKVEEKEVLKRSSDFSSDEFDDDFFNESVIKSTQALEEAFLGEMHCDDLQVVVQDAAGHGRSDDLKEYVSPIVGKPRKLSAEENYIDTKVENKSSKLSSGTNGRLPVHSNSSKQKGPLTRNNHLTGVYKLDKTVLGNNDVFGSRYNSQLENIGIPENKSESKNLKCRNMGSKNNSGSENYGELGIGTKNLKQASNYTASRGDSVGHTSDIASKVNSIKETNNSYRPRSYVLGPKTSSLESRNDVSGVRSNSLVPRSYSSGSSSSNLGSQNATVSTKRDLPQYKSNSQKEIKRGGDVNKVGLPRSRSSHCIQASTLADSGSKSLRRTNSSEHSVKLDLNDAVFGEDFDDSFFDTILSTLPENYESVSSGKNALVTGMMASGHVVPAQKTNYKMGPTKKCSNEADMSYKSKTSSSTKLVGGKLNHPPSSGVSLAESFGDDDLFHDDVLNIIDQVESQYASQPPSQFKCSQDEISRKKEEAKRRREEKMKKKHAQGHYFPVC